MSKSGNDSDAPRELPTPQVSLDHAREQLDRRTVLGQELLAQPTHSERELEEAQAKYQMWDEYNCELLRRMFSTDELRDEYLRAVERMITAGDLHGEVRRFQRKVGLKLTKLESIRERLELHVGVDPSGSESDLDPPPPSGDAVFIIHGHDRAAALELQRLIEENTGLDVVRMDQEPHGGRTLIKKFEEEASDCGYAIAVFTPDDVVTEDDEEYAQMRPNVVFELGWFAGRLGRERTCILYKEPTEIPSDLQGVGYYRFHESVRQVWLDIAGELSKAGLIE